MRRNRLCREKTTKKEDDIAKRLIIVLTLLSIIEKLADIIIKIIDKIWAS